MSDNINLNTIRANNIDDIDTIDVIDKLQDKTGKLNSTAKIVINGESFTLSAKDKGNNKVAINVTKNYASGLKGFLQKLFGYRSQVAHSITSKLATIMTSNKYAQITQNLLQFRSIVSESLKKGVKDIEIADYGLSPNRQIVSTNNLVKKIQNEFASEGVKLRFIQIDNYNAALNIAPDRLLICPKAKNMKNSETYSQTINNIKNGEHKIREDRRKSYNISPEMLDAWKNFLSREENVKKIDIPTKLNEYLHQDPNSIPEKETGWKAQFKADPDKALRNFVLKNLSYEYKDITQEEFEELVSDVKNYLDVMNIKDEKERNEKLKEFCATENWRNEKEQERYDDFYNDDIKKGYSPEEARERADDGPMYTARFQRLNSIFSIATFRETSKLGLEFFKEQNIPVMFQFADYYGNNLQGEKFNNILSETKSLDEDKKQGSAITHSELRHAKRLKERFTDFALKLAGGGKEERAQQA